MTDWRTLLSDLCILQREAAAVLDRPDLWSAPNRAASLDEVRSAENRLGVYFDASFQQFLLAANGWVRFGANRLFAANELVDAETWSPSSSSPATDADADADEEHPRNPLSVPDSHKLVLIGISTIVDRLILVSFPRAAREATSRCLDRVAGHTSEFENFAQWAHAEQRTITAALREEISQARREQ